MPQQNNIKFTIYFCIAACSMAGYYLCARKLLDEQPEIAQARAALAPTNGQAFRKAFFSPDNGMRDILVGLIAAEKKQILVAIFSFTDPVIAKALIQAQKRGVAIEIVADRNNAQSSWSKIRLLGKHNIPLYLYPADITNAIMHDKFMVFSQTLDDKQLIWTGSFNFTRSACDMNEENVIVLEDAEVCESYSNQFQLLKQRSVRTEPSNIKIDKQELFPKNTRTRKCHA